MWLWMLLQRRSRWQAVRFAVFAGVGDGVAAGVACAVGAGDEAGGLLVDVVAAVAVAVVDVAGVGLGAMRVTSAQLDTRSTNARKGAMRPTIRAYSGEREIPTDRAGDGGRRRRPQSLLLVQDEDAELAVVRVAGDAAERDARCCAAVRRECAAKGRFHGDRVRARRRRDV